MLLIWLLDLQALFCSPICRALSLHEIGTLRTVNDPKEIVTNRL
jgi:hypothetical protein